MQFCNLKANVDGNVLQKSLVKIWDSKRVMYISILTFNLSSSLVALQQTSHRDIFFFFFAQWHLSREQVKSSGKSKYKNMTSSPEDRDKKWGKADPLTSLGWHLWDWQWEGAKSHICHRVRFNSSRTHGFIPEPFFSFYCCHSLWVQIPYDRILNINGTSTDTESLASANDRWRCNQTDSLLGSK